MGFEIGDEVVHKGVEARHQYGDTNEHVLCVVTSRQSTYSGFMWVEIVRFLDGSPHQSEGNPYLVNAIDFELAERVKSLWLTKKQVDKL